MTCEARRRSISAVDPTLSTDLSAEVNVIVRNYAPEANAASLEAFAATLEASADRFLVGGDRLRLWAMLLRDRAAQS